MSINNQKSEEGNMMTNVPLNEQHLSSSKTQLILFLYTYRKYIRCLHIKSRYLYTAGKYSFGAVIMFIGIFILTGVLSRNQDLREYYNFTRLTSNERMVENPSKEDLETFSNSSWFDYVRYFVAFLFVLSGGLVLADQLYSSFLVIAALVISGFFYSNPWIFQDMSDQQQSWILLLKHVAVIGGALFLLTRGKLRFEDQKVHLRAGTIKRTIHISYLRPHQSHSIFSYPKRYFSRGQQKPVVCYYKLLNVSTTATQDEIKTSYYELAKKYHPDALKEEEKEKFKDMFKDLTEAYSVLGDTEKRARYDQLIFGDSSRGEFSNQEAYEYWKDRPSGSKRMKEEHEKQQERVREKLKNYKDYNDFLKRADHHREKNSAREHLFRGEGFKDLNYKYGPDYDYYEEAEKNHEEKYIKYRERYYETYWDTKENHEYYKQPLAKRAWSSFKKVMWFYYDLSIVWATLGLFFVLYNVHTTAKKTNVSHAYLQIIQERSLEPLEYPDRYMEPQAGQYKSDHLNKSGQSESKDPTK